MDRASRWQKGGGQCWQKLSSPNQGWRIGVSSFRSDKAAGRQTEESPLSSGIRRAEAHGTALGKTCRNRKTLCYFKNPACQPGCFVPHPQSMRLFRDSGYSIFKAFRKHIDASRSYWVTNIRALALKSPFGGLKRGFCLLFVASVGSRGPAH